MQFCDLSGIQSSADIGTQVLIVRDPLLAARHGQQPPIEFRIPEPLESEVRKRFVECSTMHLFSLGHGAIDVKDQRTEALH